VTSPSSGITPGDDSPPKRGSEEHGPFFSVSEDNLAELAVRWPRLGKDGEDDFAVDDVAARKAWEERFGPPAEFCGRGGALVTRGDGWRSLRAQSVAFAAFVFAWEQSRRARGSLLGQLPTELVSAILGQIQLRGVPQYDRLVALGEPALALETPRHFDRPLYLSFTAAGELLVPCFYSGVVLVLDPTLLRVVREIRPAVKSPVAVVEVSEIGDRSILALVESFPCHRLSLLDLDAMQYVAHSDTAAGAPPEAKLNLPIGLAYRPGSSRTPSPIGSLFVGDRGHNRVAEYSALDLSYVGCFEGVTSPAGVAVDDHRGKIVTVESGGDHSLVEFDHATRECTHKIKLTSLDKRVQDLKGVAIDDAGNAVVAAYCAGSSHQVAVISREEGTYGELLFSLAQGFCREPLGVAISQNGNFVAVSDASLKQVLIFADDGKKEREHGAAAMLE
jgi:hypothetical protein